MRFLLAALLTLGIATSAQSKPLLYGVTVNRAKLSAAQKIEFERYLQTANPPLTQVGKTCRFSGRPDLWCLALDKATAFQVIADLTQRGFGAAILTKPLTFNAK